MGLPYRPATEASELLKITKRGRAVRLRAPEGTFSYYHPDHLFTGLGWDAQSASLLFLNVPVENVLLLGLGGGTVARQCRAMFPSARIVGVEISSTVIDRAYEQFELATSRIELVHSSGEKFLATTHDKFDAIIDDMWVAGASGIKPVLQNQNWLRLVTSCLHARSLYAVNLYSRRESRFEVRTALPRLRSAFRHLRELTPGTCDTTVLVGGSELLRPLQARSRLTQLPTTIRRGLSHVTFRTLPFNGGTPCSV